MKKAQILILGLVVVIFVTGYTNAFFFTNVCIVTGTISYHGSPATRGLPVIAYIGEEKVGESLTKAEGRFELTIHEYDPSKPETKGYTSPNDIIQVKLSGLIAKPTFSPVKENIKVTLKVQQALNVRLSTWGKIKALFK